MANVEGCPVTMATPREIRRLAFQALFQLDARGEVEAEGIRAALREIGDDDPAEFTESEFEKAFALAQGAYRARRQADEESSRLAPTWPASRQPAVDRAIIRLAHYEMTTGAVSPKVAVNEAVELAKRYSTERSPSFINGVLDKILKRVLAESAAGPESRGGSGDVDAGDGAGEAA